MSSLKEDSIAGCFGVTAIFVVLLACVIPLGFIGCDIQVSEGFRDGQIQKFSHKGLFWHSWEGELAMEGFKRANNSGGSVFEFTVLDKTVVDQINNLAPEAHVRLYYKQIMKRAITQGSTPYEVWKVEEVKERK